MAQVNKISSFKSFTEIKNQETTMKLREENNAKRQETVGKIGAILDEMGLTSLSELDEDKKQALISKMFGSVSEDEAEDIEDAINKLGEPKKLEDEKIEEGNPFIYAAAKAKQDGKKEFQFNGKTYKVTLSVNTGISEENIIDESLNEGKHGMAKKLLKGIVDGNSSEAEGIKLSKDLADHYLYWINSSPYGKKNENLPLYMLIDASFNWGIERGLPKELKAELDDLKVSIKQNESFLNEARSIAKIQNEWSKVTTEMADLAAKWKAAEGDAKAELLAQMKEKTAIKKGLESELEAAVAGKDKDLELAVSEAFFRLPKDVIGNELYLASQNLTNLYNSSAVGNDIDAGVIDSIIKKLNTIKKSIKKFNSAEEVAGTVYEGAVKQFDADFNDMVKNIKSGYGWIDPEYVADTWENSSDSIDFELVKGEIYKRLIAAKLLAFADEENEEEAGQYVKSLKELGIKESLIITESKEAEEAESILNDLLDERGGDMEELHGMSMEDALDTVETYGHSGSKAKKIAQELCAMCNESVVTENSKINNVTITSDLFTADNNWWVKNKLRVSDDISKALDGCKTKHVVIDIDKIHESVVTEAEIKSDDEFKEYATSVLKKAFGADFDEAKAGEVVDGILKKCGDDYGACVGMLTSSLGESVVVEGFDAKYWEDYHNDDSGKLENPNNIQIQHEVEACAEEWNDNNENGEENEIKPATEKKVIKLAKEFVKAKGWISSDVIEAMLAQE